VFVEIFWLHDVTVPEQPFLVCDLLTVGLVDSYRTAAPPSDQQSDITYMAKGLAYRF
jgi:hypothetical protein